MSSITVSSLRRAAYFNLWSLKGLQVKGYYEHFLREYHEGIPPDTVKKQLIALLAHAKKNVPYYAGIMEKMGDDFLQDPFGYLNDFPILTKDILRTRFEDLKSADLDRRKWFYNTSGGSTGEPVRFIQDTEFIEKTGAVKLLFSRLAGREIGQSEVFLWGSERDILHGTEKLTTRMANALTNTAFVNAFRMSPERMRAFIDLLNATRPQLITAYAEALYEVACFAERSGMRVHPQKAIITSAGMLYPFMREKISEVFQCPVYNRYGSREVGDIACELPGQAGLWVAPWGNYLEAVDGDLRPVPAGTNGEIIVTCLANYAMPMIHFRIGDCAVIDPTSDPGASRQSISQLTGRTNGMFKSKDGTFFDAGYFEFMMYFKGWIKKFQVVQKGYSSILFRLAGHDTDDHREDLQEIAALTKVFMGDDCEVAFELVDEIPPLPSGKHQYLITEL